MQVTQLEDEAKPKIKQYQIMVSYEEQGVVTIEATSVKEANSKALKAMEYDGLNQLDFNCKGREYYAHGEV